MNACNREYRCNNDKCRKLLFKFGAYDFHIEKGVCLTRDETLKAMPFEIKCPRCSTMNTFTHQELILRR